MRTQENIRKMNDLELKSYRRVLCLRRERRRKMMLSALTLLATVCMIIICSVSYHSIKTSASSSFKYYTSVVVEPGETLWNLADEYIDYDYYESKNSYIDEVKSINHLNDDYAVLAGQTLIVPYYSAEYVE